MWQLSVLALVSAAAPPNGPVVINGIAFGPRMTLTCKWFTNFENSRFETCRNQEKDIFPAGEDASISCSKQSCSVMDDQARRLSGGKKAEAPEGTFTVQFIGRAAGFRHEPQYLGDGTRTVLVEKVLKVRVSK